MDSQAAQDVVRVPVRLTDGSWEYFYGGAVPVRDGAVGELMLPKAAISKPAFLAALLAPSEHRLLDEGAELLIALAVRPEAGPPADLLKHLEDLPVDVMAPECFASWRTAFNRVVRVTVGPWKSPPNEGKPGGVVLCLEGLRPKRVKVSRIVLPFTLPGRNGRAEFASLNHALTALSEVFEPWRISHSGNIYSQVLFRGDNGTWHPLDRLRRVAQAKEEDALINRRWQALMTSILPSEAAR